MIRFNFGHYDTNITMDGWAMLLAELNYIKEKKEIKQQ